MPQPSIHEGQDGQRVESQRKGSWLYCATKKGCVSSLQRKQNVCVEMNKLTQTVDWLAYYSSSPKNDFKEGSLSQ